MLEEAAVPTREVRPHVETENIMSVRAQDGAHIDNPAMTRGDVV